jgi:hypothetical protein
MLRGRAPGMDLHVRLDPELATWLRRFAADTERSVGGCVRLLLRDALERRERGGDRCDPPERRET